MATPHLFRVIVQVTGIDRAAAFYAGVLGMPGERVSPGRHYFDCGGTILACVDPTGDGDGTQPAPLPDHLYLSVDDLERVRAAIEAGGGKLAPGDVHGDPAAQIARRPWGEESFYAFDPFDNPLCFVRRGTEFLGRSRR
jgi:catechol 2,3-dioxygenase-like lactoylglutathione lyase family enzyme